MFESDYFIVIINEAIDHRLLRFSNHVYNDDDNSPLMELINCLNFLILISLPYDGVDH